MLKLTADSLHLQCRAANKNEAIKIAADALEKAGYVKPGFLHGMLAREKASLPISAQVSRFLIVLKRTLIW